MDTSPKDSAEHLQSDLKQVVALSGQSEQETREEALREYLSWRLPQLLDLQESIAQADRGEFASDDEVREVFRKYGV